MHLLGPFMHHSALKLVRMQGSYNCFQKAKSHHQQTESNLGTEGSLQ